VKAGQQLVQQAVEALVTGPQWTKTLLIITYDEHGRFYNHVAPPMATRVSLESLGTYGVRVPAFVISPWVKGGTVFGNDGLVVRVGGSGIVSTAAPGPITSQLRSLYFDHTSILKTIARCFMSQKPPYMSAWYAEASDLSSVVGNELRPSQFLPFIPYTVVYGASQKRVDVQGAAVTPGAILRQYAPKDTIAQQFSFETDGSATAANHPDRQRWKLTANSISVLDRTSFTIGNAAFPGKVLQPAGGSQDSGIPVVLGDPQGAIVGVVHTPNAWQVTGPLIPGGQVVSHP
jgi:hypothetical protein